MLPLTGYAERLSVRPGQTLRFHVANATGQAVQARVVRVLCADPNPAIGGVQFEPVPVPVRGLAAAGPQSVPSGSYGVLGDEQLLAPCNDTHSLTLTLWALPTLALSRQQVLVSWLDEAVISS